MKKYFLLLATLFLSIPMAIAQKNVKIAYIDMEYILEKVPAFAEANSQL